LLSILPAALVGRCPQAIGGPTKLIWDFTSLVCDILALHGDYVLEILGDIIFGALCAAKEGEAATKLGRRASRVQELIVEVWSSSTPLSWLVF
jgi:hypothetical protein